jgi:hypothetical protein
MHRTIGRPLADTRTDGDVVTDHERLLGVHSFFSSLIIKVSQRPTLSNMEVRHIKRVSCISCLAFLVCIKLCQSEFGSTYYYGMCPLNVYPKTRYPLILIQPNLTHDKTHGSPNGATYLTERSALCTMSLHYVTALSQCTLCTIWLHAFSRHYLTALSVRSAPLDHLIKRVKLSSEFPRWNNLVRNHVVKSIRFVPTQLPF